MSNRFAGNVGYGESQETPTDSGIWKNVITERHYYGDIQRNTKQNDRSDQANDNISVGHSISIVADAYARDNFMNILYVWWGGKPWKVADVQEIHPRLVLRLDKIYNGETA